MSVSIPGLIDPHVHLREPGGTHKEDFDTGTAAALAGGFTTVLAMPNTTPPLTDGKSLALAKEAARAKARCDYGLFLGAGQENVSVAARLAPQVVGLKLYLDQTYGPLCLRGIQAPGAHVGGWPKDRPMAVHAEGRSMAALLLLAAVHERPVHFCHVSRREEILLIRMAKERGMRVTCEVTPHHLFLCQDDLPRLGAGRGDVRPTLASADDREALWEQFEVIDCIASDHAPHTLAEKDGDNPPPGFPGLETSVPLLLTAVHEGRLTIDDIIAKCCLNPRRIFGIPEQPETVVEINPDQAWDVKGGNLYSRCGWTPFEGMRLKGRVHKVTLRGQVAFQDGEVLSPPGSGIDVAPEGG